MDDLGAVRGPVAGHRVWATGGGPGRSTQVLSLYAFQKAYREFNFGYAGALSVVMFLILMTCSWLYVRYSNALRAD